MYQFLEFDYHTLAHHIRKLKQEREALKSPWADPYKFGKLQGRLRYFEGVFVRAQIVTPRYEECVGLGSHITVVWRHQKWRQVEYEGLRGATYDIGSYLVLDGSPFRISYDSVIGRLLMGAQLGQTRELYSQPGGMNGKFVIEIVKIS